MNFAALPMSYRMPLALVAGALVPLTLSPVDIWLLALPSTALLYLLLINTTPRQAGTIGWCYGFGLFGAGASWVYVSIHVHGPAPPLLAAVLTVVFAAGLAWFHVLQCWFYRRFASALPVLGFAVCWVLGEWLRSWFLTGFPWLYLGYAHVTTFLSGIAPMFGVFGISLLLTLSGALIGAMFHRYRNDGSFIALLRSHRPTALMALWILAAATNRFVWVEPVPDQTLSVGLVQANIAQELKFSSQALQDSLQRHIDLSSTLWNNDLVVWPETAIPLTYQQAGPILDSLATTAHSNDSTLVTGLFYQDGDRIYNSITAVGNGSGIWHKQKLVPFGEYVPLRGLTENLLQLFSLPMSSLAPGPGNQELLQVGNLLAASFICYEVVYPEFVRQQARTADFLLTVSNDTWFGASWGPLQHLQMAAMRARENGRYMVRATNNGVSALINEKGEILARAPQFEAATLTGTVQIFSGRTPWNRWGNSPVLIFCLLILAVNLYQIRSAHPLKQSQ